MSQPQGPTMICATNVVKPGRARIGHLGGGVTLPRTVEILTLFSAGVGVVIGLFIAALVPVGGGQRFFMGAAFGGMAGWFLVTFSPMQNESLLTWLGLTVRTMHQQRYVEGRPVVLSVGVSLTSRQAAGRVRLMRGAVRVPEGTYDERGVARSATNRNLPEGALAVAGAFITGVQAVESVGGRALPSDTEVPQPGPGRARPAFPAAPAPFEADPHGGVPMGEEPLSAVAAVSPAAPQPLAPPRETPVAAPQQAAQPAPVQPPAPIRPAPRPAAPTATIPSPAHPDVDRTPRLRIAPKSGTDKVGRARKLKD